MPPAPPRPCDCPAALLRPVLYDSVQSARVVSCTGCAAVVVYRSEYREPSAPQADLELVGHQVLAESGETLAWLAGFPRLVPYTSPPCFLPGVLRVKDERGLAQAEREAVSSQEGRSLLARFRVVGVPGPLSTRPRHSRGPAEGGWELSPFQELARALVVPDDAPFSMLLSFVLGSQRLPAQVARERLAVREGLAGELAIAISRGGEDARAAARVVFHAAPTEPSDRKIVAKALGLRLRELCLDPFAGEAELSDHVLSLSVLGPDAAPAEEALRAVSATELFSRRSMLRDQVGKALTAIGARSP